MLELLKELCRLNGVSGAEDPVRNFIQTPVSYTHLTLPTNSLV